MTGTAKSIGRAKTVLVFGGADTAKAIVSTVVVHTRRNKKGRRLCFSGPVAFEAATIRHINDILLPIVDHILGSLGLAQKNFEISVANPGATSTSDLGVKVAGYSADVPLLLAFLSASLQMPIPEDMVTTGHIASLDGDIAAVKALSAKLTALSADKSFRCFIGPDLERDKSLEILSPAERERAGDAISAAKSKLKVITIGDIAELVQAVFTDEVVVLASLKQGFFDANGMEGADNGPLARTLCFLTARNEERFWTVLERHLLAGKKKDVKKLLGAGTRFHLKKQSYPQGMGRKLLQLVRSLPPTTRRLKTAFPLVPIKECIGLSQFARQSDYDDVRLLYDASFGPGIYPVQMTGPAKVSNKREKVNKAGADLDNVLSQIDSEYLAQNIAAPIDTARASYLVDSVTIESYEQLLDTVSAFYLHLMRHTEHVIEPANMNMIRTGALDLMERTFAGQGGLDAGLAEARDAIHGGMRFILDALTEQFKTERQINHVNRVLKEAFRLAHTGRPGPFVSAEIKAIPPERLARNYEVIVRTYVESFDKVKALLRIL